MINTGFARGQQRYNTVRTAGKANQSGAGSSSDQGLLEIWRKPRWTVGPFKHVLLSTRIGESPHGRVESHWIQNPKRTKGGEEPFWCFSFVFIITYLSRTGYWLDQNMNEDVWPDLRHLQQVLKEYSISSWTTKLLPAWGRINRNNKHGRTLFLKPLTQFFK